MKTFSLAIYLAVKEIFRNRGRFFLFSLVIALITLLVLFIAALGEGLGNGNRQYVENIDGQLIIFRENSDYVISGSRLTETTTRAARRVPGVADAGSISTSNTAIILPDHVLKVSLVGVEPDHPGFPKIKDGQSFSGLLAREAIVDQNILNRSNIKIGDEITVRSTQGTKDEYYQLTVVGTTNGQSFFFQPSIFVSPQTWERVRPKSAAEFNNSNPVVNVVAVKLVDPAQVEQVKVKLNDTLSNIEVADIPTTINNIPGYSAQQGTVKTQGGFTLLIGILVIGGFFQIQILQKVPQIGVLKAIGASNGVVGWAAVIQIGIVTAMGVLIGGGMTFLFSLFFPPTVPLVFNGQASVLAILALLLIGPAGGLVSVIYAVRIEPLKALKLT
jgi:hemin transport system permease protein